MYKIIVSLIISLLALTGCANTANYQRVVNNWRGANAQGLVATWGAPDAVVRLPNGNTVYMYSHQQLYSTPTYSSQVAPVFVNKGVPYSVGFNDVFDRSQTVSLYCRTWFEANPRGVIVSSQFQGNNCVASNPNSLKP